MGQALVNGGKGFLGKSLVNRLLAQGQDARLFANRSGESVDRDCEEVEKEFDQKALSYEHNRLSEWYKIQGEKILRVIDPNIKNGVILDIGCGTGWLLRKFSKSFPDWEGIGIDLSPLMIEAAREKARQDGIANVSFFCGNWEKYELGDFRFDLPEKPITFITCVSTFHYFSDPYSVMRKIYKVLIPGGQFLLLDRAKDWSLFTSIWDWLHRFVIRDHVQFYQSAELTKILQEAGFTDIKVSWRINKYFWKGKFHTSLVLLSGRKPADGLKLSEK